MALPYTPGQLAVAHAEEDGALPDVARRPAGRLLLAAQPGRAGLRRARRARGSRTSRSPAARCPSRSRTPCACCRRAACSRRRVAVGAVPRRRRSVRVRLRRRSPWARGAGYDAVVCAIGPGIVGTGTRLGHGGLAAAEAANAAAALGGGPCSRPASRRRDARERHRGVSHHTRAVLELCLGDVVARVARRPGRPPPGATRRGRRRRLARRLRRPPARRTWAAARTRTRGSSRPRSPPAWCARLARARRLSA